VDNYFSSHTSSISVEWIVSSAFTDHRKWTERSIKSRLCTGAVKAFSEGNTWGTRRRRNSPGWSEAEPWVLNISMQPALKERQRIASACPGYLTVVVECWDEPRCSQSFTAKIPVRPIPQLLQSWVFSRTDPGFRSARPWAEFLLRLRRVKIPLALCSSGPPDFST
jgi:hypothetical protein